MARVDEWAGLTPRDVRLFGVWESLLAAYTALESLVDRTLKSECELPLAWFDVLFQLNRAPRGRLFMHQLARKLLLTNSGLTRRVERMENAGLIRREPFDRRSIHVVLTDAGRAGLARGIPVAQRLIRRSIVDNIRDSEVDAVEAALARIASSAMTDVEEVTRTVASE